MTTTVPRAPAPPASPAAPAPVQPPATGSVLSRRLAASRASVRESFSGSPGRLRLLGAAAIAISLLGGVLGAFALQQRAASLEQAQSDTAQLVRVQSIMINLVRADAAATNAYLIAGLEPPEQRAEYASSLAAASRDIAVAARANQQDAERLGEVNQTLTRYSGLVEQARANNREGKPVGATYIRQASGLIRSDSGVLALAGVVDGTAERVDASYDRGAWWLALLVAAGVMVVGGLVTVQVSLARRSHRYLNVPVAAGAALLLVVLVVAVVAISSAQGRANDVRDGAYSNTVALAQARIVAFDAKTNESLSLINRGAGASFEPTIKARLDAAEERLTDAGSAGARARAALSAWRSTDTEVRRLDREETWDRAVALATRAPEDRNGDEGSNQVFAAFDDTSAKALEAQSEAATSRLDGPRALLLTLAGLLLLAGIVSAVASWAGVSVRLEEYR